MYEITKIEIKKGILATFLGYKILFFHLRKMLKYNKVSLICPYYSYLYDYNIKHQLWKATRTKCPRLHH